HDGDFRLRAGAAGRVIDIGDHEAFDTFPQAEDGVGVWIAPAAGGRYGFGEVVLNDAGSRQIAEAVGIKLEIVIEADDVRAPGTELIDAKRTAVAVGGAGYGPGRVLVGGAHCRPADGGVPPGGHRCATHQFCVAV